MNVVRVRVGLGVAAVAGLSFLSTGAAGAQVHAQACPPYPALSCPPPTVTSSTLDPRFRAERAEPAASPAALHTPAPSNLPFTGADVVEMSGIGLAAIGVGTILVRRSRAHHSSD